MRRTVFLSYRHESDEHRARVRKLAERLERAGLKVVLDQFVQEREFNHGGPDEGWPRWSVSQASNPEHRVLIIESPGWFRCYELTEEPGKALGAAAEASVIAQRLHNGGGRNRDIRIVTFDTLDPSTLPTNLQGYHLFTDPENFSSLSTWLTDGDLANEPVQSAPLDWPMQTPTLHWPVANHNKVRSQFEALLVRGARGRYLPLRGPTESGKSHLTQLMLRNALQVTDLACGRFDFKGNIDRDNELEAFVQHLDVPKPPLASTLNLRLGRILDSLKALAPRPALLIFDTYEAAGEAQDWVEKLVLPALVRSPWLRVVIAGQHVPRSAGAIWESHACAPMLLSSPSPEEWFKFSKPYRPTVTIDFVRQAHEFCNGRASILAQLLGPI